MKKWRKENIAAKMAKGGGINEYGESGVNNGVKMAKAKSNVAKNRISEAKWWRRKWRGEIIIMAKWIASGIENNGEMAKAWRRRRQRRRRSGMAGISHRQ
jgi:hypothetical protein